MANYIYGIDIGGTTVKMGLFDEEGTMIDKWEIVTHKEDGGEQILPDIAASIKEKNEVLRQKIFLESAWVYRDRSQKRVLF